MRNEQEAVHLEVLSAIRGRIRLQLERSISSIQPLQRLEGIRSCRYNPRINTLLFEYDPAAIS